MERNWKQPSQTQNTEINHIPQDAIQCLFSPEAQSSALSRLGISQLADSLLWTLQQCVSSRPSRLTDWRLQNWEVGSRYRGASLSCRSQLHDRRSRSPGMGIQSIAGSSVMSHGRHGVLSSTLDRCKAPEMGSSAPVKLRLGPSWICRIGKLWLTRYWLEI